MYATMPVDSWHIYFAGCGKDHLDHLHKRRKRNVRQLLAGTAASQIRTIDTVPINFGRASIAGGQCKVVADKKQLHAAALF